MAEVEFVVVVADAMDDNDVVAWWNCDDSLHSRDDDVAFVDEVEVDPYSDDIVVAYCIAHNLVAFVPLLHYCASWPHSHHHYCNAVAS